MNPHSTTTSLIIFQMFQFPQKSNYVPHVDYNKISQISKTHKLHHLQIYCHSNRNSIPSSSIKNPFTASYLTNTFGLTPESALRTAKYLELKNPEQPESVINLLKTYGFSQADISKLVKRHPKVLGLSVKLISSKIEFLISKGASSRDVVDILVVSPCIFDRSLKDVIIPVYNSIKDVVHSDGTAIAFLKRLRIDPFASSGVSDIPVRMNLLRDNGVPEPNIAYVLDLAPWALVWSCRLERTVEELKEMGFDPSKKNFVTALIVKCAQSESLWRKKIDVYKSWGWTEEEIFEIFKKAPRYLACSEKKISAVMDFFVNKLGWGPSVIRRCPPLLGMSLEKRIIPRDSVIQSLLSRGSIEKESYRPRVFMLTEEDFLNKYVRCYASADELLKLYIGRREMNHS